MKSKLSLLVATLFAAASAHAAGPYRHTSNGTTQPIIYYDASGAITYIDCIAGSRCSINTGTRTLGFSDRQYSSFRIRTGATLPSGNDHFAFGVRGNRMNAACGTQILSFPFLGRGIALYAGLGQIAFENFTHNCLGPYAGLLHSTKRPITFKASTAYFVEIWADNYNTGYEVWEEYRASNGTLNYRIAAEGDCRTQAASGEAFLCARHNTADKATANRAFIASTNNAPWVVDSWMID